MGDVIRIGADAKPSMTKGELAKELAIAGAGAAIGYATVKKHPVVGAMLGWLGGRIVTAWIK